MNLKPLFDNVVLKQIPIPPTSTIFIPQNDERPEHAIVESVGMGGIINGEKIEMVVQPNDKVLFNKYATTEFLLDGEKKYLIKQSDILAIITD